MQNVCKGFSSSPISGGSRGGARGSGHPLFLDQTEVRRAEQIFLETSRSGSGTADLQRNGHWKPVNCALRDERLHVTS